MTRAFVLNPYEKKKEEGGRTPESRLAEAVALTEAIGVFVAGSYIQPVNSVRPATYIGKGHMETVAEILNERDISLVIMNCSLSPGQQRNLERAWNVKVIDRTALILEIFGARARTREGRLQVELAHLTYQRSRLVRSWTHLERQRGGYGFVGGPGETQIEIDRRLLDERISALKSDLEKVRRTRGLHRKARSRVPYPIVALVGYTNAGKSTLFNVLSQADVTARNQLFATLDPTMRALELPTGQTAILSDTVGFVSDLPTELVAAFHATLEEVQEADIILHVRDIAHPEHEKQKADVENVLRSLDLEEKLSQGGIEVLNKVDLLPASEADVIRARGRRREKQCVTSAVTGEGTEALLDMLGTFLSRDWQTLRVHLPLSDGATFSWCHRKGEVLASESNEKGHILKVRLHERDVNRLKQEDIVILEQESS